MDYVCIECNTVFPSYLKACPVCGCPTSFILDHEDNSFHNQSVGFSAATDLNILTQAAESGDSSAMYWLAYRLFYDEMDDNGAKSWLLKAIDSGYEPAEESLIEWFPSSDEYDSSITGDDCVLQDLFSRFDSIVFLDLETSGLDPEKDQIIELAAIKAQNSSGNITVVDEMDEMISLPDEKHLPSKITEITGITDTILQRAGKPSETVLRQFVKFLGTGRALLIAYNAQFDLSFLYQSMNSNGDASRFAGLSALDALTVYKDRREYPHRLENAIDTYQLGSLVHNTHKAIDDVYALFEVIKAMDNECQDLNQYINLFGYHPKYGINGVKLPGIEYRVQSYNSFRKLYE